MSLTASAHSANVFRSTRRRVNGRNIRSFRQSVFRRRVVYVPLPCLLHIDHFQVLNPLQRGYQVVLGRVPHPEDKIPVTLLFTRREAAAALGTEVDNAAASSPMKSGHISGSADEAVRAEEGGSRQQPKTHKQARVERPQTARSAR